MNVDVEYQQNLISLELHLHTLTQILKGELGGGVLKVEDWDLFSSPKPWTPKFSKLKPNCKPKCSYFVNPNPKW